MGRRQSPGQIQRVLPDIVRVKAALPVTNDATELFFGFFVSGFLFKKPLNHGFVSGFNQTTGCVGCQVNKRDRLFTQCLILVDSLAQFNAIHNRHIHITQNNEWLLRHRQQIRQSPLAVGKKPDWIWYAKFGQHPLDQKLIVFVVFDKQYRSLLHWNTGMDKSCV